MSAGLVIWRQRPGLEVFLVHPGGPFWAGRDDGAWSIPKGEIEPGEDPLEAARREVAEEIGCFITGDAVPLGTVRQRGGKLVHAFAVAAELEPAGIVSNTVDVTWPPRSGRTITVPEVDRAAWFPLAGARRALLEGQAPLLDRLASEIGA